jgi:hypothetical protein
MTNDSSFKGNRNSKRSLSVSQDAQNVNSVASLLPQIRMAVDQSNLKLTQRQLKITNLIRQDRIGGAPLTGHNLA